MVKKEKAANLGKVLTPKGLRARRLRLSAHTAIEFYDIQDRLGFDRSTEAIDWLIQNAKSSIDALSVKAAETEVVKKQSRPFPIQGLNDFHGQGQGLFFPSMANSQFQNLNYSQKAVSNDSNADFSGLIFNATQNEMPLFNSYHHQQQQQHSNNGNGFPSFPLWD